MKHFVSQRQFIVRIIKSAFWRDKFSTITLSTSVLFNIGIWLFLFFKMEPSEYPVPIHFNIYFGIDVVEYYYQAFIIPVVGIVVILVNLFFAFYLYEKEKFIAQFLAGSSLFIQILLFLAGLGVVVIR